jgi:MoaA/NifB/PqqE/SkfB family radical SAM enzyme
MSVKGLVRYVLPEITLNKWRYRKKKQAVLTGKYLAGPESLNCFVTDRCNLRCKMCANHRIDLLNESVLLHRKVRDMSVELMRQILDTFPSIKRVTFAGVGEPMLVSNVFELVKVAGDRGIQCGMVSNGTKLAERLEEVLNSHLIEISISLNASNAEKYSELVGMPHKTFYEVSNAIKELIDRRNALGKKLRVVVSAVLRRSLLNEAPDIFRHAASLGVEAVNFHNFIPDLGRQGEVNDVISSRERAQLKLLAKKCQSQKGTPRLFLPKPINESPGKLCLSFFRNINVDGEGNVGGCMRVMPPAPENGNIRDGKDVWQNAYFTRYRNIFQNPAIPLPKMCLYCVENSIS